MKRSSKGQTREEFKARVREWAGKLDVRIRSCALRPMRSKWASCSTNGTLSFNVELLGMNRQIADYVIVHELLHFRVPNHGKLWKAVMRAYLGNYERAEAQLSKEASAVRRDPHPLPSARKRGRPKGR